MESGYLVAWRSGLLEKRIRQSRELLADCSLCPRKCRVNRLMDEKGMCRTGLLAEVASYCPHFGEESVLVGKQGSGTIFFCGCNLLCVFCQNYDISHPEHNSCDVLSDEQLGSMMVGLQQQGCHNINFVTPSHVVPQILSALPHAIEKGLTVPLVFNSSGYDEVETLTLLEGIVDIYMPDFKFWNSETARRYARAGNYPEKARAALQEMQRQVGDLQVNSKGRAERGMLVRHLLMPGLMEETVEILKFIAYSISTNCYVNIMDQYRPEGMAGNFPELNATIDTKEYKKVKKIAREVGLLRLEEKDLSVLVKRLFKG